VADNAEARARRHGSRVERAAAHDDAGRGAVDAEEVAVHSDDGGGSARVLLDAGERLRPEEGTVCEPGPERVQRAVRLRCGDDVEHDGAARRELHLALVGHAGHEQLLRDDLLFRGVARSVGGHGERPGDGDEDEQLAEHDPAAG
jgi:hypothetical protein